MLNYVDNTISHYSLLSDAADGGIFSYTVDVIEDLRRRLSHDGTITFSVRAHPGAKASRIKGVMDDGSVKIDIAAPADDGKANAALVRFLAKEFGVKGAQVEIVAGSGARRKIVRIRSAAR